MCVCTNNGGPGRGGRGYVERAWFLMEFMNLARAPELTRMYVCLCKFTLFSTIFIWSGFRLYTHNFLSLDGVYSYVKFKRRQILHKINHVNSVYATLERVYRSHWSSRRTELDTNGLRNPLAQERFGSLSLSRLNGILLCNTHDIEIEWPWR